MIPGRLAALLAVGLIVVGGCAAGVPSTAAFDPAQPCAGADEQRMPGAYPELESLIPLALEGVSPTQRDSGRLCSRASLGSLFDAGVSEIHFGGGTWDRGGGKGISLVVFEADGLTAADLLASYETAARANSQVHDVRTSEPTIGGATGHRLDVLNGESFQAILAWPAGPSGRVRVVLAADQTNDQIDAAVDAFD